ncbi:cystatin-A-like isoform X2 [Dysidea avara]|uniref:cystatin-A-like isoform X2 n=1 Tax=Dysidea avara TaxID=196820 RepID=UPI00331C71F4
MVDHTVTAGGWITPPKQATSEIQSIADRVKVDAEKRLGKRFAMYKAIDYETQTVDGLNFKVKVQVSPQTPSYIELVVLRDLMGKYKLIKVESVNS